MDKIIVKKVNDAFIKLIAPVSLLYELADFFTFMVPGYQFMPKFKARIWNGKICLLNRANGNLYYGLHRKVKEFAESRNYEFEYEDPKEFESEKISGTDVTEFFKSLNLCVEPRDYQIAGFHTAIQKKRGILLSPTASGKSLIIYALARWYNVKTLIIVPTTSLVLQMHSDFAEYAKKDKSFDADRDCHKIFSGQLKTSDKQVSVSTWQSLFRLPQQYFDQYDLVIVDEVHLAKAQSLKDIMEKLVNCKYRFGTTGTLDGSDTHEYVLEGLFGAVHRVTTTKNLMDQKYLSKLRINAVMLKWPEHIAKAAKKLSYQDEIRFLISNKKRNKFIRNLAIAQTANTLVTFQYVKDHGKILYEMIKEKLAETDPKRKVFFVFGGTDAEAREEVRRITETESNAIIVASVGVFATGINIRNLDNIIFAAPSKSRIRTLQSIGRVLRIGRSDKANLFDIVDDLQSGTHRNFALKHFYERMNFYNQEEFEYKIVEIVLKI